MISREYRQVLDIAVAGHVCLDVIPRFESAQPHTQPFFRPGALVEVGPAVTATGGAVSNTGIALHKLGSRVRLIGMVGDDVFGKAVIAAFEEHAPALAKPMIVSGDYPTSYTVVLNPPGHDRMFLHCPGANDAFVPDAISGEHLNGIGLFHFGYPPLMRQIYSDGGLRLAEKFEAIRQQDIFTSLDMAMPDPASDAGSVDWRSWLQRVLPTVDLFCPSIDEIEAMLDLHDVEDGPLTDPLQRIRGFAELLLEMGTRVVLLKLGENGLYLRTGTTIPDRLTSTDAIWENRELLIPCFAVDAVGTTGAGDTTVAGFLAAVASGHGPEAAMTAAVATGASCVEASDATSMIPSWKKLHERISAGWSSLPLTFDTEEWRPKPEEPIMLGPSDGR